FVLPFDVLDSGRDLDRGWPYA
nr:RecName: Full=Serine protease inhibitor 3; AltName: Full=PSPI-22 [Solanum tuberosum]